MCSHMNGYSGNTFRLVKSATEWVYAKISAISDQGLRNNTLAQSIIQGGEDPDFGLTDLYEAIEAGDYPSWTVYIQVMTPKEAETFKCTNLLQVQRCGLLLTAYSALDNIFDLTKGVHIHHYRLPYVILMCILVYLRVASYRSAPSGGRKDHSQSEPVSLLLCEADECLILT